MKKIKVIGLIMALTFVTTCFVGCKDNTQNENNEGNVGTQVVENNEVNEQEEVKKFLELKEGMAEKIQLYAGAVNNIKSYYEADESATIDEYGVSPLIANKKGTEDPLSKLGCMVRDLNNDGVEEFLLYDFEAEDNTIVSMYTLVAAEGGSGDERTVYHILNSHENRKYELMNDNTIRVVITPSETSVFTEYLKLDEEANLVPIESVQMLANESGDKTYIHMLDGAENGTEVSGDALTAIDSKYVPATVEMSALF